LPKQPLRQHDRHAAPVVRRTRGRADRTDLPVDPLAQRGEQCIVDGRAAQSLGVFEQHRPRAHASQRQPQGVESSVREDRARRHAGQRKVDRAACARLEVAAARAGRLRRDPHRGDQLVGGERQGPHAVLDVEFGERNGSRAARSGHLDVRRERQQRRGHVAAERRVTALALRRHVADFAAELQAVGVGAAPPFALVVEDAACVEAQVAAEGGHGAVAGAGDAGRGFGKRRQRSRDARIVRERFERHAGADAPAAGVLLDPRELRDRTEVDQRLRRADAASQVRNQVGAAGDDARRRQTRQQGAGFGGGGRPVKSERRQAGHARASAGP
jgi:hypothetical protein